MPREKPDAPSAFSEIKSLVNDLKSLPHESKAKVLEAMGRMASRNLENPALLVKAGAVPSLVNLLSTGTDGSQIAAATAIGWIAQGSPERQSALAKAVLPLVTLLRMGSNKAQQWAAFALTSLSEAPENHAPMLKGGVVGPLVRIVRVGIDDAKIHGALCIANLCAGSGAPNEAAQSEFARAEVRSIANVVLSTPIHLIEAHRWVCHLPLDSYCTLTDSNPTSRSCRGCSRCSRRARRRWPRPWASRASPPHTAPTRTS